MFLCFDLFEYDISIEDCILLDTVINFTVTIHFKISLIYQFKIVSYQL